MQKNIYQLHKFIWCLQLWKTCSIWNICIFDCRIKLFVIIDDILNVRMFFSTNQANAVIDLLNSRYNINICIITLNAGQQIFATTVTNMCRLIIRMNQLLWKKMSFIIVFVYISINNLISADCHIINKGSNNWKFNQKFEHIFSTSGCFCQFIQISRADTNNMIVVF